MNSKGFFLKYSVIRNSCSRTYLAHSNCLARAVPQLDFILNRLMSTLFKTIAATLFTNNNTRNKISVAKRKCTTYFMEFCKVRKHGKSIPQKKKKTKRLKCGSLQAQIGERWKKEDECHFLPGVQTVT